MSATPDLDSRLDEALEETFPASDPPAVHSIDPNELKPKPQPAPPPDATNP
jgi:hypothetical protein